MPYPDRFYPVVDSLKWVERLTKLGVGTIQLRAKELNDADALQIVSDALAATGTQHLASRPFTTLSGGEKQRVVIAAALAQISGDDRQGRLLLLDEPTASLDLG